MLDCPLCGEPCTEGPHPEFLFCKGCDMAIRKQETIAQNRVRAYAPNWVEAHSKSRDVNTKMDFIVGLVKKLLPAGRILDVGCASGVLVNKLATIGYEAEGIDWSEAAVSFASRNMVGVFTIGDAGLESIKGENMYDLIIASHIVEHLEYPQGLFKGAERLLKPGAHFCVAVPNLAWYDPRKAWRGVSSIFDPDHVVGYTYGSLSQVLWRSGFRITKAITRTHGTDLLTALCVAGYSKMVHKGNQPSPQAAGRMARGAYEVLVALPILPSVMYLPNRFSERNYSGMELIIISKKGGRLLD